MSKVTSMMVLKPLSTFKGKLTLLVTAAILLPLVAAGFIFGNIWRDGIIEAYRSELQAKLNSIEILITVGESEMVDQIDRLAKDKRVKEAFWSSPKDQLKKTLTTQRKVLDIAMLAVFDPQGKRIASAKFKSKDLELDFSKLDQLYVARSDKGFFLVYLTTIEDNDELQGYVAGGIELGGSEEVASWQEIGFRNFVFWLNGEMILSDIAGARLSAPLTYEPEGVVHFRVNGEDWAGMVAGRKWGNDELQFAFLRPLAGIKRAVIKSVITVALIVGGVFALALAALSFLINKIANPLRQLSSYARNLAENNFSFSHDSGLTHLAQESHDEVGGLAASFLHLQQQLQSYLETLTHTTRSKARMQSELKIARTIQMNMLPRQTPMAANGVAFEIAGIIEPAREVGGDFYDYFMLDDKRLCLVIGDVSDKGVPASLFMAMSKTLIRVVTTLARDWGDQAIAPDEVLRRVNKELCRDNELFMFVTVFYGLLDTSSGEFCYSSAGHPMPFRLHSDCSLTALPPIRAVPLGIRLNTTYRSERATIQSGETLVLYTDGVSEAMNAAGKAYSEQRLAGVIRTSHSATASELAQTIVSDVKQFADAEQPSDDLTLLVITRGKSPHA